MPPIRILINATTITVGGGVQAAVSFVEYAAAIGEIGPEFAFAVSQPVFEGLPGSLRCDSRVHRFDRTPANLAQRCRIGRALRKLETAFRPDLVYSIGFPSYVAFSAPEVGRYTNGWEICDFPAAWKYLSTRERILRTVKSQYRLRWAQNARYFETQTEVAKAGIVRKLGADPDHVLVLPNAVNSRFIEAGQIKLYPRRRHRILCLSAAHRHKNLVIIPMVASMLEKEFGLDCQFILTLPADSDLLRAILRDARQWFISHRVENVGPLDLDGCVREYRDAACVFLPTLAEIFSATYLEAMAMAVPIVTPDLDFARAICGKAAVYYDALSPRAAAKAIYLVLSDANLRTGLIDRGRERLRQFPDSAIKHERLVAWLTMVASKERAGKQR